ncbi:hypothetical protein EV143_104103 [Flavobacterium chryseum]|uniref:hypothetical protein n=1 Tax=Flavobacterium sp. P3160 TaxID=2512113 RepID=UPI0010613EDC|nr:hypothetical protein [Flavobacterium sp. P3160]TDO77340.1 hypothetical protein EV143_104103 [Flavobacterium sp. P3160]
METFTLNIENKPFIKSMPDEPAEYQIYAEYMSNIILQLPNSGQLQFLTGTSSGQASFYFKNNQGAVNSSLYNNFLDQRIAGEGTQYGVRQVALTSDSFINSYLSVYTKLRYQLSPNDKARQQLLYGKVSSTVRKIIPLWNAYVDEFQPNNIFKLHETNTDIALIQITDVLNTVWINTEYILTLKEDPSFPYNHISDFRNIYNQIPETVPVEMVELMVEIYKISGEAGATTAEIANAVHTTAIIIYNLVHPTHENKGLSLTGSEKLIPGLLFEPEYPDDIVNQLSNNPAVSYTNNNDVVKLSSELLKINIVNSEDLTISPLKFLSNTLESGEINSVFKETFSGASYVVEAIVYNPVVNPQMKSTPVPFDIISNTGWMFSEPVKEAIKNGYPAPTGVTGYVFNSEPNFNFKEGGDFGFIKSFVFSQFLELYITFNECNVDKVKKYFEENKKSKFEFLGKSVGNPSQTFSCSCEFGSETNESVTVIIRPAAPGFILPDSSDVANSSCQLIAVEIVYPFA